VPDEPDDTELEEELRRIVAQADPVPPHLIDAAVADFAWRTIDADLAELVFDSLIDQEETALVRGSGQGRMLSFRTSNLTIDVEVAGTEESRTLVGQLVPPQEASVEIRHGGDVDTTRVDELGRFSAGPLHSGPISLRCLPGAASEPPVVTDWVVI
jgi:hypothetical protein